MSTMTLSGHSVSSRLERLTLMSRLAEHCVLSDAALAAQKAAIAGKLDRLRRGKRAFKVVLALSSLLFVVSLLMQMKMAATLFLVLIFATVVFGLVTSIRFDFEEDRLFYFDRRFRSLSSLELHDLFENVDGRNDPTLRLAIANLYKQNQLLRVSDLPLIKEVLRLDDEQSAIHSIESFVADRIA